MSTASQALRPCSWIPDQVRDDDLGGSGGGRDILVLAARAARAAGAGRRSGLGLVAFVGGGDGRRQDVERDPLLVAALLGLVRGAGARRGAARYSPLRSPRSLARGSRGARALAARFVAVSRRGSRSRRGSSRRGLVAADVLAARSLARRRRSAFAPILVLILVAVVIIVALARPLLLEAGAALVEDAEIMIRKLEVIFGLDAVALHLRVARQPLIFLEQLGGVAALPVVLAVARTGIVAARRSTPPPPRPRLRPP